MTPDNIRTDSRWAESRRAESRRAESRRAESRRAESRGGKTVTLFASLLAMVAGAGASLMICLLAGLSRHECVINTIAGALIIGGGVFSLLDHRRTHRNHDLEIKSIVEAAALDATIAAQRAIAEQAITEPPVGSEPYFHHEDHAESAGYDQGQLTSRLPGTTPFLEHFDRK
jgi:hypothetical protein